MSLSVVVSNSCESWVYIFQINMFKLRLTPEPIFESVLLADILKHHHHIAPPLSMSLKRTTWSHSIIQTVHGYGCSQFEAHVVTH